MPTTYKSFVRDLNLSAKPRIELSHPKNQAQIKRRLTSSFRQSSLTLFLGAGVSIPSGLPDWSTVTNRLTKMIFQSSDGQQVVKHIQKLEIPEPRKLRFLEESVPAFGLAVRDAMYQGYSRKNKRKNPSLRAIAHLAKSAIARRRTLNIITYNVDDLLEEYLDAAGLRQHYSVISCEKSYRDESKSVCVYHPHGYLPRDGKADALIQASLVFSERQYHSTYFDHTRWANVIQRTSLERTTCLFVGCSLNDPNTRRLLDQTKADGIASPQRHVAIMRKSSTYDSDRKNMIQDFVTSEDIKSLGVTPYWISNWHDIPRALSME